MTAGIGVEFSELVRRALESRTGEVFIAIPGIVTSYDAAKRTCSVVPAVRRPMPDEDGSVEGEDLPELQNVRVVFPRSSKFSIHFNLEAGDEVELRFQQWDIAQFRATGKVSTPGDLRHAGIGSVLAYAGFVSNARAQEDAGDVDESIGVPGGQRLHFTESALKAGTGAQFVALANLVQTALNSIRSAFNAHTHPDPASGFTGTPVDPLTALGPVASSNLKAD